MHELQPTCYAGSETAARTAEPPHTTGTHLLASGCPLGLPPPLTGLPAPLTLGVAPSSNPRSSNPGLLQPSGLAPLPGPALSIPSDLSPPAGLQQGPPPTGQKQPPPPGLLQRPPPATLMASGEAVDDDWKQAQVNSRGLKVYTRDWMLRLRDQCQSPPSDLQATDLIALDWRSSMAAPQV